jgi:peptidoglycan/LPS O-acetylase OafA/YrhL
MAHRTYKPDEIPLGAQVFELGHMAVAAFIVVSGFCLALPVLKYNGFKEGTFGFLKRRFIRILPACFTAALVGLGVMLTVFPERASHLLSFPAILHHLLMNQDYAASHRMTWNAPLWSIAIEWRLYFVFALLVIPLWVTRRIKFSWVAFLTVGIFILLSRYFRVSAFSAHFAALFLIGVFGATLLHRNISRLTLSLGIHGFLVAGIVLAFTYMEQAKAWTYIVVDVFTGIATVSLLLLAIRHQESLANQILSWQPLSLTGAWSYSIYLFHLPIITIIFSTIPESFTELQRAFLWLVTLPIVLGSCYAFYRVAEKPSVDYLAQQKATSPQVRAAPQSAPVLP